MPIQREFFKTPQIRQNDADDRVPGPRVVPCYAPTRHGGQLFESNGEPHHTNRRPNQNDYTVCL